jgi:hypothetical protein
MRSWIDTQFLHARDQRRSFDPHACRRSVGDSYSPARDSQDAENLIALIGFVRAKGVPAVVAEFGGRSLQRCAMGKDHRTLDEVFQLANVPRPMPSRELPQGGSGNRFDLLLHAAARLLCEVADQQLRDESIDCAAGRVWTAMQGRINSKL